MVKVLYANKNTGTVVHDIYLSCSEHEIKEYILKFGTAEVDFPVKLVKELNDNEMNMILYSLNASPKKQKELIDCFYVSCNKIWEEVKFDDFISDIRTLLDEEYKPKRINLNERTAND